MQIDGIQAAIRTKKAITPQGDAIKSAYNMKDLGKF